MSPILHHIECYNWKYATRSHLASHKTKVITLSHHFDTSQNIKIAWQLQ